MKLPNGYGSVYKLSGNRRKPWVARKTKGWNEKGQPVYYFVGYYKTKADALSALGAFNLDPEYMEYIPLSAIYDKWSNEKYPTLGTSALFKYTHSWEMLESLHDADINQITLDALQNAVNNLNKNTPVLTTVKSLLRQLFDYAVKHEYITPDKNRVKYLVIGSNNPNKITRSLFTIDEINALKNGNTDVTRLYTILLYTGMRISELLGLTQDDIHDDYIHVKQAKTTAGVRDIPIHDYIRPLLKYIPFKNSYPHYRYELQKMYPHHNAHDTRHTFITALVENGIDPIVIKSIVGHKGTGVTETIYTHISLAKKLEAIKKVPY